MKRRQFAHAAVAGACALTMAGCQKDCDTDAASSSNSQANPKVKWKLATSWPKFFPGLGTAPEQLAKIVGEMTQGQFQMKVYGANELVPPLEVFDSVSRGTVQGGHCSAYYWKGKMPAACFFTAVPFGMTAQEMNSWLHYGGGLGLWEELYAPHNLIPMAGGNTGVQMSGWFNKEINQLEDLKGLKMRIPGLAGEVMQKLGVTTVSLPGGELYTALQTGVIDATEWVGPYNDRAFNLHKIAKYYYTSGWHEAGPTLEFIFNKDDFAALPAHYQAILRTAARMVNQDMLDEYMAKNTQSLVQLVDDGVQLRTFPADVVEALKQNSDVVLRDISKTDALSEKIYSSYIAYLEQMKMYQKHSEFGYMQLRG